jgi:membrane-associated protease RseP (regulator of RpoE activity)
MPDSPAAQAGIEPHDVLLQFNESKLGEIADLAKAVGEAKEQEATLRLIRGGEEQELKVTPQKRPVMLPTVRDEAPALSRLRQVLPFEPGKEPFGMLFVRPGMIGPFGFTAPELPKDSSLTITREGDGPAKVTFKQGDQTWEATSDKLDLESLPEEVRPFVRRALGLGGEFQVELRGPEGAILKNRIPGLAPPEIRVEKLRLFRDEKVKQDTGEAKEAPANAAEPEATESAVGELRRAVQELRQELQKLRQERAERNQ